jgi:two-component system NtrC family response regulator
MAPMGKRVLIVDDVEDWQKTILGLLTDEGYEVVAVGDRESALDAVRAGRFDLAVIDIRLDETDEDNTAGLSLASEVKSVLTDLPVVIITGYQTPDTIARAMRPDEMGQTLAVDFVQKTDAIELVDIVNRRLASSDT